MQFMLCCAHNEEIMFVAHFETGRYEFKMMLFFSGILFFLIKYCFLIFQMVILYFRHCIKINCSDMKCFIFILLREITNLI